MALLKKGFKKYGLEEIETKRINVNDTNFTFNFTENNSTYTNTYGGVDANTSETKRGVLSLNKKCVPAGTVIKFTGVTTNNSSATLVAADVAEADITSTDINKKVFVLAEDFYDGDKDFVYWDVKNIGNLI